MQRMSRAQRLLLIYLIWELQKPRIVQKVTKLYAGGGGPASIAELTVKDHDLLDGLGDDDHTQYFLQDGSELFNDDLRLNFPYGILFPYDADGVADEWYMGLRWNSDEERFELIEHESGAWKPTSWLKLSVGELLCEGAHRVRDDSGRLEITSDAILELIGSTGIELTASSGIIHLLSETVFTGKVRSVLPVTDDLYDCGGSSFRWKNVKCVTLEATNALITSMKTHFNPFTDDTYDIGSGTFHWRDGYFSRDIFTDSLKEATPTVGITAENVLLKDGNVYVGINEFQTTNLALKESTSTRLGVFVKGTSTKRDLHVRNVFVDSIVYCGSFSGTWTNSVIASKAATNSSFQFKAYTTAFEVVAQASSSAAGAGTASFDILQGGDITMLTDKMIQLSDETTGAPANAGNRGKLRLVKGGAGVADVFQKCMKSAADTYSWVTIATG